MTMGLIGEDVVGEDVVGEAGSRAPDEHPPSGRQIAPSRVSDLEGHRRGLVLGDLLAGRPVDPDHAGQVLGVDFSQYHWAAVLRGSPGSVVGTDDLVRFSLLLARRTGGAPPLVAHSGPQIWMWTRWKRPPAEEKIAGLCHRLSPPPGLHAITGPVGRGMEGFRRSLRGARTAEQSAGPSPDNWLMLFSEVPSVIVAGTDPDQGWQFATQVLGDLMKDDHWSAELRETLRLYLALDHSRAGVAARMYINRNTVAYRVEKAMGMLGKPMDSDPFDIRLALEIERSLRHLRRGAGADPSYPPAGIPLRPGRGCGELSLPPLPPANGPLPRHRASSASRKREYPAEDSARVDGAPMSTTRPRSSRTTVSA